MLNSHEDNTIIQKYLMDLKISLIFKPSFFSSSSYKIFPGHFITRFGFWCIKRCSKSVRVCNLLHIFRWDVRVGHFPPLKVSMRCPTFKLREHEYMNVWSCRKALEYIIWYCGLRSFIRGKLKSLTALIRTINLLPWRQRVWPITGIMCSLTALNPLTKAQEPR